MVYVKPWSGDDHYYCKKENPRDDYWKLEHYGGLSTKKMLAMLTERGYDPGSTKSIDTLRHCLQRADQGLQSYTKLENDDLRQLIAKRGINTDIGRPGRKGSRDQLMGVLKREDCNPRFERFTQLPPELRARIYGLYYREFNEPLDAPKQPPLALTSSLLRKEALPLFYASCVFELPMATVTQFWEGRVRRHLVFPNDTLLWLQSTRQEDFADIQHVRIKVVRVRQQINQWVHNAQPSPITSSDFNGEPTMNLFLDFYKSEGFRIVPDVTHNSWNALDVDAFFKELAKMRHKIKSREGDCKLEREDFFALRRALEVAMIT